MFRTHENILAGLLGSGLGPATERFEHHLADRLCSAKITEAWVSYSDLLEFLEDTIASAVLEAIFGSALLSGNPSFIRDLWQFDEGIMNLGRRLPEIFIPKAYKTRRKLLQSIKIWHANASMNSSKAVHLEDKEETDLFWGSKMMRERFKMLLDIDDQDHDSVASTDLALIWALEELTTSRTVTNLIPSSLILILQSFRDSALCSEIRHSLEKAVDDTARLKFDLRKLETNPLLLSMYAETLRWAVQIHVPRAAQHQDTSIGKMLIPKNKLILVNTWLAHTDEEVWNTKNGTFPLDDFWARRFLVDPENPLSGPLKCNDTPHKESSAGKGNDQRIHFSTKGLEGAWIPYGGKIFTIPLAETLNDRDIKVATMLVPAVCSQNV
ncbi:MAG: hypothetical protein Q9220_007484 [cf. Caloplaca sp. 1 TL-2023]